MNTGCWRHSFDCDSERDPVYRCFTSSTCWYTFIVRRALELKIWKALRLDAGRLILWAEVIYLANSWYMTNYLLQVLKFEKGSQTPSLTLGEALVPGSDTSHFCKPTDVAVASNGEFFVADGWIFDTTKLLSKSQQTNNFSTLIHWCLLLQKLIGSL